MEKIPKQSRERTNYRVCDNGEHPAASVSLFDGRVVRATFLGPFGKII